MLKERFIRFAEQECKNSSPLYESLALYISENDKLLDICNQAPEQQPIPNLFLGSVHYLLLKGYDTELLEMYQNPPEEDMLFESFNQFCLKYDKEIIKLMNSKIVQTNEVRRAAYIYPLLCFIQSRNDKPVNLIEIGTSAGLQLLADKYNYKYNEKDDVYNAGKESLTISSSVRKGNMGKVFRIKPIIKRRIGIDLNVLDINKEEDYEWLKALVWPEHNDRLMLLENARDILMEYPVHLIEGDALKMLESVVCGLPRDEIICIFHTHVANQLSDGQKLQLLSTINMLSKDRNLYHIYNNINDKLLHIDEYKNNEKKSMIVGETEGHGNWFDWLL